jgi:ribonuclease D
MAAATLAPAEAWRDIGQPRGLTPIAARIMMATASWRLQTARTTNKPLGHILEDVALVDFAKKCAQWDGKAGDGSKSSLDAFVDQAMNAARIAPAHRAALQTEMAQAIADRNREIPPELCRPVFEERGPGGAKRNEPVAPAAARASKWAEQLLLITAATSEELGIPPRLLGTRSDAETVARQMSEGGAAVLSNAAILKGWRRSQIGERWLAFLSGDGALVADSTTQLGLCWRSLQAKPLGDDVHSSVSGQTASRPAAKGAKAAKSKPSKAKATAPAAQGKSKQRITKKTQGYGRLSTEK